MVLGCPPSRPGSRRLRQCPLSETVVSSGMCSKVASSLSEMAAPNGEAASSSRTLEKASLGFQIPQRGRSCQGGFNNSSSMKGLADLGQALRAACNLKKHPNSEGHSGASALPAYLI